MTPLAPEVIRQSFQLIRDNSPSEIHEIVDVLERRLLLDESMLAMQGRIDEVTEHLTERLAAGGTVLPFPGHSVRVGDVA